MPIARAVTSPRTPQLLALLIIATICSAPVPLHAADYSFTLIREQGSDFGNNFLASNGQRKINDAGEVSYLTEPFFFSNRIDKGDGTNQTLIASPSFWGLNQVGNGTIANSGDVYFTGGHTGTTVGIFRGDGGTPVPIVFGNQDTSTAGTKTYFHDVSASNSGNIAYRQRTSVCSGPSMCGTATQSIVAIIGGSGTTIAQEGSGWTDLQTHAPAINDTGHVAFVGKRTSDPSNYYLMRYNHVPGDYTYIDTDFIGGKGYSINNSGAVAYAEIPAVKVFHNGVITTIASTADGFSGLMKVGTGEVAINDAGDVAFWGNVTTYNGNPVEWEGVYTGPDIINDRVLVRGDTVLGHVISKVQLFGMNNAGQMLLSVEALSPDPWSGLIVASPFDGDYDGNDEFDAADYVLWRATDGAQDGYDLWRGNFGESANATAAISATNAAVPEPTSTALLLCAAAFAATTRSASRRG